MMEKPSFLQQQKDVPEPQAMIGGIGAIGSIGRHVGSQIPTAPLMARVAQLESNLDALARQRADENQQLAEFVQDILRRLNNVESQIGG